MSHHHEHHHHAHAHTHTANKKVLRVSFVIIAAFMLLEAFGGWLTHSLALLSDAGHMFSDAFSLGVALWAFKLGEKETTLQKTFGYKRFEILTAMFNGLSLVVIAVLIFYEAVKRLLYPPEIATLGMLVISVVGLLVNIGVAVYMLKNSDTEANVNMRGAYLHVLSDLVGSVGAIAAAVLMIAFGWKWADPLASVFVAALVGRSGWSLLKQTLHILMEGAPENIHTDDLLAVIRNTDGVKSVHDLHVWTITSNINVLSCHIVVDGSMTVAESEQIAYRIEHELSHKNIGHCTIQIESEPHPHPDSVLCANETDGAHHHHGVHADLNAVYTFTCENPAAFKSLTVTSFKNWPRLKNIDVAVLSNQGQAAARVNADKPEVRW